MQFQGQCLQQGKGCCGEQHCHENGCFQLLSTQRVNSWEEEVAGLCQSCQGMRGNRTKGGSKDPHHHSKANMLPPHLPTVAPPTQAHRVPRMHRGMLRPGIVHCTCSEDHLQLEKEKLVVLRGVEEQLERSNNLQQEMLQIKRAKLDILQKQLVLTEV